MAEIIIIIYITEVFHNVFVSNKECSILKIPGNVIHQNIWAVTGTALGSNSF